MRTIVLLITCISTLLHAQDTISIRTLDRALIVTDPARGVRRLSRTVPLVSADTPVRRILLDLTYACPDSMRCADWDYLDHVLVRPINGTDTFELARMLTPYGGLFPKDWAFTWRSDVSDLAAILKDSVELIHIHHGYEPASDRGWAVTLDLHYITGPPIAPILGITEIYRGNFPYGNDSRPIATQLPARTIRTHPDARWLRIRSQQTGHGMMANDGCAEFCAKWRRVHVGGQVVQDRRLWKECASNPLWPQAGTWIFDRADWCPGELQPPDQLTVPLEPEDRTCTVRFEMEPYQVDSSTAMTNLSAYGIQFGPTRARHDAMIIEILAPSLQARHARALEGHEGTRFVIGNAGADTLRMLTIQHGVAGGDTLRSRWHGALPFGQTDTVTLAAARTCAAPGGSYFVSLSRPNGQPDAWPYDNMARSAYHVPDVMPTSLIVQLRTNAEPQHNALRISSNGKEQFVHVPGSLQPDSSYRDTLHLPPGCHRLQLTDTAGDGLSFWFNTEGGHGHLRLLDLKGRLLKRFESDHGNGITYLFHTGSTPNILPDTVPDVHVFPRRTKGHTRLYYFANDAAPLHVMISDEQGRTVQEIRPAGYIKEAEMPLDLTDQPPGRYHIAVLRDGRTVFKDRIRVER